MRVWSSILVEVNPSYFRHRKLLFASQYSVDRWSQWPSKQTRWDIDCPVGEMGTHVDIGPEVGRLGAAVNPLGQAPELRSTEPPDDLCHLPTIASLVHFSSPSQSGFFTYVQQIFYRHTDTSLTLYIVVQATISTFFSKSRKNFTGQRLLQLNVYTS